MRGEIETIYEENDITSGVGDVGLEKLDKDKIMTRHNFFTLAFWACIVTVGILQALQGQGVGDFTVIIGVLGAFEHMLAGKTS